MTDDRKTELRKNIDAGIQMIDDALRELIKEGESLPSLEAAIRMEMGTVFNRAFRSSCEGVKKMENKDE